MKLINFILFVVVFFALTACEKKIENKSLVIYCSIDEIWSAPLFKKFTDKTGIIVKPVYDSEANKSVGLANRIIAEKNNPIADIYWSGEPLQIERLALSGVLKPYLEAGIKLPEYFSSWNNIFWFPNSFRQRVFVINTNIIKNSKIHPVSVFDLTNKIYYGKMAMANPNFGSTLFHFVSLYTKLGEKDFLAFMANIRNNKVKVYAGNSQVALQTVNGNSAIGLTDNDDAQREIKKGAPIVMKGCGDYFPSGIGIINKKEIKNEQLKQFVNFIISDEVQSELHLKVPYNYKVSQVMENKLYDDNSAESSENMKEFIGALRNP